METTIKRAASRILPALVFATLFTWAAWAASFTGPKSKYYLANPGDNTIYVVQGTKVVASFPMAYGRGDLEGALAVSQTIRTRADDLREGWGPAGEYTLAGDTSGYSYYTPFTGDGRYYDGTTDGVTNYFVDHGPGDPLNGGVYRADYFWQNPEWLFYPKEICNDDYPAEGCHGLSGIAYDVTNNSLWITGKGNSLIGDYSLDGALLAIFDTRGPGYNAAAAVDPADHTLWVTTYGTSLLRQYSLDPPTLGQVLQYGVPTGLPGYRFEGGEFQVVQCSATPTITSLSATPSVLWPPDHRMAPVELKVTTSGGCGDVSCRIVSVTSSEPADRNGGNWTITGDLTLNLRAEHLDQGPGRIYAITVRCTDTFAHRAEGTVYVAVPRETLR